MIRVLVVDDSATVRKVLCEELARFDDIEVVGSAVDAYAARDKIAALRPDVLTLDIDMPRMDGLAFLDRLMTHHPMPVVVVSAVTPDSSAAALRALELGAVEVVPKPGSIYSTPDVALELVRAVRAAAQARMRGQIAQPRHTERTVAPPLRTSYTLLAIGASTGGIRAIEEIMREMPATTPGTLIVQHLPGRFTAGFAERLDGVSAMTTREARDGDLVTTGVALVAPANLHTIVQRRDGNCRVRLKSGPAVHYQRPSVDVLFHSVATQVGEDAIGVLLTGMGADGAKGLLEMRRHGAYTLAEAEESCVVFGMPREAIQIGAAMEVAPLPRMARAVLDALASVGGAGRATLRHGWGA